MRLRPIRIRPRHAAAAALVAAAAAALSSDRVVFLLPERALAGFRNAVARDLQAERVLSALSFDGPFLLDAARNLPVEAEHVRSVRGPAGDARRFKGDEDAVVGTGARWDRLGTSCTALLRIRFSADGGEDQEVCWSDPGQPVGFSLHGGRLRFQFPTRDRNGVCVESPRLARGRWYTAVAAVDAAAGTARLFLDGALCDARAAAPAAPGLSPIVFGAPHWHPLHADVDEAVFWSRTLSDREIRRASRPGWSLVRAVSPCKAAAISLCETARTALPAAVRSLERLHPRLLSRSLLPDAPALDVVLSKKDRRHFARVHQDAMRSGGRTDRGANFRRCSFATAGGLRRGELCLDNPYVYPSRVDRPAFVAVVDLDGDGVEEHLRLYPPEDFTLLHPGYGPPLSMFAHSYVRLSLSGDPLGLYCIDVFRHNGEAWVLDMTYFNPASPLHQNPRRVFDEWDLLSADERARRRDRLLADILADPHSRWSRRAWMNAREEQIAALAEKDLPLPFPTAQNALGANPAPFYVTEDLDLGAKTLRDAVRWESSRPDLVSADGRVSRPPGDVPVRVSLTGYDAAGAVAARLELRVMPEAPRLPALFLYLAIPPTKHRRSDFTAEFRSAGGGPPRVLSGFEGRSAGLKPRGNTSYAKGAKKPLSLKFDRPHGIFGPADDRGLYLLGGYSDRTRLRSHLCFDAFRRMGALPFPGGAAAGHHEAPEVGWIEVFVNNDYYGVFEMCSRPKAPMFAPAPPPSLFKVKRTTPIFREVSSRAFSQELPNVEETSCEEDVLHLMRQTVPGVPADDFAATARRELDLNNLVDFQLLLNFTGNADGRITNFLLAREAAGERRYFLVPWDYDKTFHPEFPLKNLSNHLLLRLRDGVPGFRTALAERWRGLRAGPFADGAALARLDADAAFLEPYMAFESEILGKPASAFPDAVAALRADVLRRLRWMDRWVDSLAAPAPRPEARP